MRRPACTRVLDEIGLAIANGTLAAGEVVRIDQLEERFSVSRSVVRETLRVLAAVGMVRPRRRVGVQILPSSEWNLYDPQVIRWRLASDARDTQLRALSELRMAIGPEAARLTAERAPHAVASELMGLAGRLWAAGREGDTQLFLELDILFHRLVLTASGNEMFGTVHTLVAEVLTGRAHYGLMPEHPQDEALQLHVDVAGAIQRGDGPSARAAMLGILTIASDEMAAALAVGGASSSR